VAEPRYFEATSGDSIKDRTRSGKRHGHDMPKRSNPTMTFHSKTTTQSIENPATKARIPETKSRFCCDTYLGKIRTAGILVKNGSAAA